MNTRIFTSIWFLPICLLSGLAQAQEGVASDPTLRYFALSTPAQYVFGRQLEQRLFNGWDATSSWYGNQAGSDDDGEALAISSFRVDVDRMLLHPGANGQIGLGLGWQKQATDVTGYGAGAMDGPRLSLVGRLQITDALRLYGRTAWLPQLEDDEFGEFEAGLFYDVRPSLSLRAGIRWLNDDDLGNDSVFGQRRFMLGAGMRW